MVRLATLSTSPVGTLLTALIHTSFVLLEGCPFSCAHNPLPVFLQPGLWTSLWSTIEHLWICIWIFLATMSSTLATSSSSYSSSAAYLAAHQSHIRFRERISTLIGYMIVAITPNVIYIKPASTMLSCQA